MKTSNDFECFRIDVFHDSDTIMKSSVCLFSFDIPRSQEPLRNYGSFQNGVAIMKNVYSNVLIAIELKNSF